MAITHHYVLCPYYVTDKKDNISCEDIYRTFRSGQKKYKWMRNYCEASWDECPYAKELNEMYERIEKGEDMAKEQAEQREKAWKKEHHNLSIQLGSAKKKIERQQSKIDELMAKNRELYLKWRDTDQELTNVNMKVYGQLQKMSQLYEDRMAYLIDTKCGGEMKEKDVEAWAKGKEYAIVHEDGEERVWKVIFKEEEKKDGRKKVQKKK